MSKLPRPSKNHFLVKINKKIQKDRLEKEGMLYLPVERVHIGMTRNMQSAEIIDIGERAHQVFPEAEIGNILLFHHFIEDEGDESFKVHEDDEANYYVVAALELPGHNQPTFGVFNGKEIIPHADYVVLKGPEKIDRTELKKKESLFLFSNYKMSRDEINARIKEIKEVEIPSLAKSGMNNPIAVNEIRAKEHHMQQLSAILNKKQSIPLTVAYANPLLNRWFGKKVKSGDILYCLNTATDYIINFQGTEYRIVSVSYIHGLKAA